MNHAKAIAVAAVISILALITIGNVKYSKTRADLIETWRSIKPGTDIRIIVDALGNPAYHFDPSADYPTYGYQLSDEYKREHHLYVFYIKGWGPYLLLVFTDEYGKVTFVGNDPT